jgi:hypothetical protein
LISFSYGKMQIANDTDAERCANYRRRALRYVLDFIYYFDSAGRCIPFGRSMIYRFAVISTLSVLPFAFPCDGNGADKGDLPADFPLKWGHIKGMVLRHLRWWSKQEDIFKSDGTLNIGYCYENMTMTENYNGFGESNPVWVREAGGPVLKIRAYCIVTRHYRFALLVHQGIRLSLCPGNPPLLDL